jgi:phosphatidylglycerol---prolipoprotein diacylglyceryl transferase
MNTHYVHNIDPVIFDLGSLQIRWYGLMYVIGFLLAGYLVKILIRKKFFKVPEDKVDSLITTMIICMFIGARLFYVFIYNWDYYSENMMDLLAVWKGGLSFHGAIAGLLTGGYIFAKKNNLSWFEVMDTVALSGTLPLFFGRLGNFINGELYGRPTDSWVGVIFPNGGGPYPRHPSQLYEGILEGIVLCAILWLIRTKVRVYGIIASVFLMGYGVFRFIIEFFREPDVQLGYFFGFLTMGQLLCVIMVLIGGAGIMWAKKKNITI